MSWDHSDYRVDKGHEVVNVQFEVTPDVPDLIAVLAAQFALRGFSAEDACVIVLDMLADAMSDTPGRLH